ncbi:acyl carrier protein 1 [Planoprotostelium fungivorum]|uniref:Acyl carrier protein n=1 Tax=Planoprotostelium fungivorum TaxID=1890364 RepID=A0A2P6NLZ5_9EUKA|nr:acyl carrier protein 1 [Planoprotostelium fungivorum]
MIRGLSNIRLARMPSATPLRNVRPQTHIMPTRFFASAGASLDRSQVTDRVIHVVKNFHKLDGATTVKPDSHFANDLGLDSLDNVEVVMAFEDEFAVEIPDAEADKIQSVNQAVEYILNNPHANTLQFSHHPQSPPSSPISIPDPSSFLFRPYHKPKHQNLHERLLDKVLKGYNMTECECQCGTAEITQRNRTRKCRRQQELHARMTTETSFVPANRDKRKSTIKGMGDHRLAPQGAPPDIQEVISPGIALFVSRLIYGPFETDEGQDRVEAFLLTYRKFMSPEDLFVFWNNRYARLVEMKDVDMKDKTENAMNFMRTWLKGYYKEDFSLQRKELQECFLKLNITDSQIKSIIFHATASATILKKTQLLGTSPPAPLSPKMSTPKKSKETESPRPRRYTTAPTGKSQHKTIDVTGGVGSIDIETFDLRLQPHISPIRSESLDSMMGELKLRQMQQTRARRAAEHIDCFLSFPPEELAESITARDSQMYRSISPLELLWKVKWGARPRPDADYVLPTSLESITNSFNITSLWVQTVMVSATNPPDRLERFYYFLSMAKRMYQLGNFNTLLAIILALKGSPLGCKKAFWITVPEKHTIALAQFEAMFDPSTHFKGYKDVLKTWKGPVIPYIGLLLKDLIYMAENNPMLSNNSPNPNVLAMFHKFLKNIRSTQAAAYNFVPKEEHMTYLSNCRVTDDASELIRIFNEKATDLIEASPHIREIREPTITRMTVSIVKDATPATKEETETKERGGTIITESFASVKEMIAAREGASMTEKTVLTEGATPT